MLNDMFNKALAVCALIYTYNHLKKNFKCYLTSFRKYIIMYTHHYLYKSQAPHTKLYIIVNIIFKNVFI